jgi:hypothetical protein
MVHRVCQTEVNEYELSAFLIGHYHNSELPQPPLIHAAASPRSTLLPAGRRSWRRREGGKSAASLRTVDSMIVQLLIISDVAWLASSSTVPTRSDSLYTLSLLIDLPQCAPYGCINVSSNILCCWTGSWCLTLSVTLL